MKHITGTALLLSLAACAGGQGSKLAGDDSTRSNPFNYLWCNGGDFVMKNECTVVPSHSGGSGPLLRICSLRVEINGYKESGKGVIRYLEEQGALSSDEIHVSQTYDPATHTYPEALNVGFWGDTLRCDASQSCFWYFNNADTINFGRGTIRHEDNGFRVSVTGQDGATADWRYESCDARWLESGYGL